MKLYLVIFCLFLFDGETCSSVVTSSSYYHAKLMMHVRLWGLYYKDECVLGIVN